MKIIKSNKKYNSMNLKRNNPTKTLSNFRESIKAETYNLRKNNTTMKIGKIINKIKEIMRNKCKKILEQQKDQVEKNFWMKRINKQKRNQTKHQHSVRNPCQDHDQETKTNLHKWTPDNNSKDKREGSEVNQRGETYQSEQLLKNTINN